MRLTNYMRDAFVRAVMDDVPKIDYDAEFKRAVRSINQEQFERQFPGVLYSTAFESDWLSTNYYSAGVYGLSSVVIVGPTSQFKDSPEYRQRIDEVIAKFKEQKARREKLEESLRSVAYGVNTRKALAAALPEFEKYMPQEKPEVLRTAPALTNVVADFVRAGWPRTGSAVSATS